MSAQRKTTKTTTAKPAAAKSAARSATINTLDAASSSAETVVNMSNKAVKDIRDSFATEAQKTQEKLYEMSRESAENIAKTADTASRTIYEIVNVCRDNVEACMECGNISSNIAKDMGQEISDYVNQAATEQMELAKEMFACRTLNDVVELQNKIFRNVIDGYFEQCSKLSEMAFECASEVCEPINQRVSEASEQMGKIMTQKG